MHTYMYACSRVKRNSFYRKSELRMFLLISCGHISAPKQYTNMASPYKALQSCVKHFGKQLRNCGAQRPETCTNCLYYIHALVFYNISFSWLLPLDSSQFIIFFANLGVWTDLKHFIHFSTSFSPWSMYSLKKHSVLFPFSLLKIWGDCLSCGGGGECLCPHKTLFSFLFLFYTKF